VIAAAPLLFLLSTAAIGNSSAIGETATVVENAARAIDRAQISDLAGHRWTAADFTGRVVLIDFWATWCAPCLADMPRLKRLREKHPRTDFEILGVSLDVSSRHSFVSWLNRNRIEWPQILEGRGYGAELARLFAVDRLPRTIVIGRDGRIAAVDVRGDQLVALIDQLVAAETVTLTSTGTREK
jgi:thiol-disulfide isomerase/thioredoxin